MKTRTCALQSMGLTEDFTTTPNTQHEPVKAWVIKKRMKNLVLVQHVYVYVAIGYCI